jgi:hypothetical protein
LIKAELYAVEKRVLKSEVKALGSIFWRIEAIWHWPTFTGCRLKARFQKGEIIAFPNHDRNCKRTVAGCSCAAKRCCDTREENVALQRNNQPKMATAVVTATTKQLWWQQHLQDNSQMQHEWQCTTGTKKVRTPSSALTASIGSQHFASWQRAGPFASRPTKQRR